MILILKPATKTTGFPYRQCLGWDYTLQVRTGLLHIEDTGWSYCGELAVYKSNLYTLFYKGIPCFPLLLICITVTDKLNSENLEGKVDGVLGVMTSVPLKCLPMVLSAPKTVNVRNF